MLNTNPQEQFEELKTTLLDQVKDTFPIQDAKGRFEVRVKNLKVRDVLGVDDIRGQLQARLKGKSWAAPVYATVEIVDSEGKVLVIKPKVRIAEIPKLTRHYSYIVDGKEKMIAKQWRLKPGAYVKETQKPGEYEAQFQLAKGKSFDVRLDPPTGYMFVAMGTRKIPLYSLLSASGVPDDRMRKVWGDRAFEANIKKAKPEKDLRSFYTATGKGQPDADADMNMELQQYFAGTEMDPEVTKTTLGKGFAQVNEDVLFRASKKLMSVSAGDVVADQIDSLQFKELWTAKDHFADKLNSSRNEIHNRIRKALGKDKVQDAIRKGDVAIRDIIMPDLIQKPLTHVFGTSLAANSNQINPLSMLGDQSYVTIMGPGGIQNEHAITDQNTALDPSQLGFVDPVFTPEGSPGVALHLSAGTQIKDRKPHTKVFNLKTRKIEMITPAVAAQSVVVLPDQVKWKNNKPTPLGTNVQVSDRKGNIRTHAFADADYALIASSQIFAVESNLVPFMQNDSAHRSTMSARHMAQAISVTGREAPLVQVEATPGESFEKLVASRFLSHMAPVDGTVKEVLKDHIVILGSDGKKHTVDLYDHYPLNDPKAMLHSTALVKPGTKVKKGQPLADNNYTKSGQLALGTNIRTAYISTGTNHEDGIVLSESAAKKLGSEHLYKPSLLTSTDTIVSARKFAAHKPTAFKKAQLTGMSEGGVVAVGTIVNKGDPLVLALNPETNPDSMDVRVMSRLSKKTRLDYTNASLTWDHDKPGEVVRVTKKGRSWVVHVKTKEQAVVGSKVSTRHSAKGIVACYDDQTEFLTKRGWLLGGDLDSSDVFATIREENLEFQWQKATALHQYPYEGDLYRIENQNVDLMVTPNHRMFALSPIPKALQKAIQLKDSVGIWGVTLAEDIEGKQARYLSAAAHWEGVPLPEWINLPSTQVSKKAHRNPVTRVPGRYWASFMGWWLSEGSAYYVKSRRGYVVEVSQKEEANPQKYQKIQELLSQMGFHFKTRPHGFEIQHKGLFERLSVFGKANVKYIPREILDAPKEDLQAFLDAYIAGDGSVHGASTRIHTTSPRMADGLQEVMFKLGISSVPRYAEKPEPWSDLYSLCVKKNPAPWVNATARTKEKQAEGYVPYSGMVYCCSVPNKLLVVRRGKKAVVCGNSILPDDEMPRDGKGRSMGMLISPVAIPGRMNPGQILETVAGKIAEKTGKPYVVKNFVGNKDYLADLKKELKKHGLSETETLFDPKTGRKLGDVTAGPHYAFQLVHQIDKKSSTRHGGFYVKGLAPHIRYDQNKVPRGGGEGGAQSLGALGLYGALSSGLKDNLREMQTWKSDKEQAENVWRSLTQGELVPPPQIPFVYKKFEAQMKTIGLNLDKQGSYLRLVPNTDAEVLALSRGEVTRPDMAVIAKNVKPENGGIFDTRIFGGRVGRHWGHVKLVEPMPNPVFAKPIAQLLGIKPQEIELVVSGKMELPKFGTGPRAIKQALSAVNVTAKMEDVKKRLNDPRVKAGALDSTNALHKSLRMLRENKLTPVKAFMMQNVPVLPPIYRPFVSSPDKTDRIDPMNNLYRRLGQVNVSLAASDKDKVPYELTLGNRGDLYKEMENLFGTTPKGKKAFDIDIRGKKEIKDRTLPGVLHMIAGASPKDGFFQDKLVGKKQDYTARATIVADPTLGPDEVGVPKKIAIELYRPFVSRQLIRGGLNPIEAQEHIQKRSPRALTALEKVVVDHPVLLKRDPVLHAYGLVGQKVKLINSAAIKVSPLILPPINGDIDGDQVALMVPISEKAKAEIRKIMPSQRPLSDATGDVLYKPTNEAMLGLYRSTLRSHGKVTGKKFATLRDAEAAFLKNQIDLPDTITVGSARTTLGRARIARVVPERFRADILNGSKPFGKKEMSAVLKHTAIKEPKHFAEVASGLSRLGFQMAYESGHSITLSDLEPLRGVRDRIVNKAKAEVQQLQGKNVAGRATEIYMGATRKLHEEYGKHYDKNPTNISDMAKGGIKSKKPQFQGMVMAPMLVQDYRGRPSKEPITKSFAEGIGVGDYWMQAQGARRGVIQKVEGISEPGYWTKMMVQVNIDQPVTGTDCGTRSGVMLPLTNRDVVDRYLASPVKVGTRVVPAHTPVTPDLQGAFAKAGIRSVAVRSPLKCRQPQGVCSVCMGLHPSGQHYAVGENVGLAAAQSLGERAAQIMLRQTHGGGLVTTDKQVVDSFDTVQSLFAMQRKRNPQQAPVAGRNGSITKVVAQRHGGWAIYTSTSKKPFYSRQRPLNHIKPGYHFKRGEKLTHGDPNMHDLLKAQGVGAVQDHMVKRIGSIYDGEGIKQRHVELAVRNATGLVRVADPGDHPTFVRGDYLQKALVDEVNRNVLRGKRQMRVDTVLKSIAEIPGASQKDWMGRLMTKNLSKVMTVAAQRGEKSNIHGLHPIPGVAYGTEFGRGKPPTRY